MVFCRASLVTVEAQAGVDRELLIDDPPILREGGEFAQTARNRGRGSELYALGKRLVLPSDQDRVFVEHTRHARVINFAAELQGMLTVKFKPVRVVNFPPLKPFRSPADVGEIVTGVTFWQQLKR